jgi:hypothetical protein
VLLSSSALGQEPEPEWPRQIIVSEGKIIVYQPQPDTLEGNTVSGRVAVSVTREGETTPVFGTVWMAARLETDRDTRTATILDVDVTAVRFPEITPEQEQRLASILEEVIPRWELEISMDRLLASLELAETQRKEAQDLKMEPPNIIFSTDPAVLVPLDGKPQLRSVEDSNLQRVINTPFTIIYSPSDKTYYLYAGEAAWYAATDLAGTWKLTYVVPSSVEALAPSEQEAEEAGYGAEEEEGEEEEEEPGPPPRIIVATEPTELIVVDGEPMYEPISDLDLLYMSNTESDVLFDLHSQQYFVLLSGRWFASKSTEGPWTYMASDELPDSFAKIPFESDVGHLLTFVAGTEEAEAAVMDNQVPQTSAIDRKAAKLEVTYDGEPKFEPIADTGLQYAANTSTPVIKVEDKYYACDQAVWFVSSSPTGPWAVADSVPSEIYTIPAESPVYNVTYVYVYDSSPEVVYVGYYPGYAGSYVYGGTVCYGTGYYYTGWYGSYYYARPSTWGFHVRYNPYTGWNFGFSYHSGPFHFYIGTGTWWRGGWWGPARWHGYHRGYHRGWHRGARAGFRAGYRAGTRRQPRNNIYRTQRNVARNAPRATPATRAQPSVARGQANNVYADRSGNVHRKTDQGWQQRTQSGWQSSQGVDRAHASNRASTQQHLERSDQARQQGTTRTSNYQRSQPSRQTGTRSRGGGGRRR